MRVSQILNNQFRRQYCESVPRRHVDRTAKQVYVGGIAWAATHEDVKRHFNSCGPITEVKIPIDRDTGRVRGFAFLTFENQSSVQSALDLSGSEFMGRTLKVSMSNEGKSQNNFNNE